MSKSRYITIQTSEIKSTTGEYYPDIMSYPINEFEFQDVQKEHIVTQADVLRIDLLMLREYGISQYDDIVLALNNVSHPQLLEAGDKILLPSLRDLNNFLRTHMQKEG